MSNIVLAALAVTHAQIAPRVAAVAASPGGRVLADGLIPTLNTQADQVSTLIGTVAGIAVTVMMLMRSHKAGWGLGTVLGALFTGAIVLFAVHGGMTWLSNQTNTQLTSNS